MIFGIHLFQVLILFNVMDFVPFDGNKNKIGNFFKMALFISPFFLLFSLLIKESDLKKLHFEENKINKGYIWLIVYIVISFALLVLLILYKRG